MSTSTISEIQSASVGMGQILMARGPDTLNAVLGSCIGAALFHPRLKVGVLAHVVLPDSTGRQGTPGKFADTAIPHMLDLLRAEGIPTSGLIAKLAGGAAMFGGGGPMQIGQSNTDAVAAALAKVHIPCQGQHVGGNKGRRVTLDCSTGELKIEIIGCPPVTL